MTGILRRAFRSPTINTWVALAIRVGGLALLLPLVLRHLDLHQVLIWQLQSSVIATTLWIDFGITPTFSRFVALARGGGRMRDFTGGKDRDVDGSQDQVSLPDVIRASGRVYIRMGVLGTLLALALGTAALAGPIGNLDNPTEGWLSWSLTLLMVPFSLLGGANTAVLVGMDRITQLRRVESLVALAQVLSTSAVVFLTSDLVWIAATYSFWSVVFFAVNWWQRRRALAGLAPEHSDHQVAEIRILGAVWMAAWRSGIGVLFSAGVIQGSGLLMPQIASAEVAAQYLILLRIVTVLSQLSQAPFYSKLPAMTKANAEGNHATMVTLAARGMRLALWTMLLGIVAAVFILPLCLQWIGSSVQISNPGMALLLGVAFFAERYGSMHMQIYTLSGRVLWHKLNGATGVIIMILFGAFWPFVGPMALPLGMLAGYGAFLCPIISRLSLRFMHESRWSFERRTSLQPLAGLILCAVLFVFVYPTELHLPWAGQTAEMHE